MPQWAINPEQTTRHLAAMVAINSINPGLDPTGPGEAAMAAWLVDTCRALGLDVETADTAPNRPNVIARWPGSGGGKSLLLTGHTDVVGVQSMDIEPFNPHVENGRLYGRGSFDMKCGLAAILSATAALKAGGFAPRGDLILGFVTDEEFSSLGTEALVKTIKVDGAILTEPSANQIGIAHKGFAWVTLKTNGLAAHGSLHDTGIDAIAHMGRLLAALEDMERNILPERHHPLLGRPSVHASLINGGLGYSTYPDTCVLEVEHRPLPRETEQEILSLWQDALARLSAEDDTFSASVEMKLHRQGYEISPEAPLVRMLSAAYQNALDEKPAYRGMFGWLDSAVLGEAGIPTVVFGPEGTGAHAAVEYVDLESVFRCAAVLAEAAAEWCG